MEQNEHRHERNIANHVYVKRTESYRLLKVLLQVSICYTELLRHSGLSITFTIAGMRNAKQKQKNGWQSRHELVHGFTALTIEHPQVTCHKVFRTSPASFSVASGAYTRNQS